MNRELWKKTLEAFNPRQALRADEIDDLYAARPDAASEQILRLLELQPDSAPFFVMCGSRGSGKSTELSRIEHRLRDDRLLLRLPLERTLPEEGNTVALLAVVGLVGLSALQAADHSEAGNLGKSYEQALKALQSHDQSSEIDVGALLGGGAKLAAIWDPSLATAGLSATAGAVATVAKSGAIAKVKQFLSKHVARRAFLDAGQEAAEGMLDVTNSILAHLERKGGAPVILGDGLDKLERLEELELVFQQPRLLQDLAAPLVLSGPINLQHSSEFNAVRQFAEPVVLYNLLVVSREGHSADEELSGREVLSDLVGRRVARFDLPRDLLGPEAFARLATASGGSVRDFNELIRASVVEGLPVLQGEQLTPEAVDKGVRHLRHQLEMRMNQESLDVLRRVLRTGRLQAGEECSELLWNNYILCYPNEHVWYRPHELLVEYLQHLDEIEAESATTTGE